MKLFRTRAVSGLLLLILTVSILLSSLTSCRWFTYVADSKNEIVENIGDSSDDILKKSYVADYLRDWGMPLFDTMKFRRIESHFISKYNYGSGLPDRYTHAKMTAELYLSELYDEIPTDDKTKVTDGLLTCYVAVLEDPYAAYRPPVQSDAYFDDINGEYAGIGVEVEYNDQDKTIKIANVFHGSPAEDAGLEVGDLFYAIDGKTVEEIGYDKAVYNVRGEVGTTVQLTMIRGGDFKTFDVVRQKIEEISVIKTYDNETKIGYIKVSSFKRNTSEQFAKAIDELEAEGALGVIFDLRSNTGGLLSSVCEMVSYLIPTGKTIVSYQERGSEKVELKSFDDRDGVDHVLNIPCVVLCNERTASAAEIFTSAVRDFTKEGLLRAKTVGTLTFGKGIMQNSYEYTPDHSSVTFTIAYYNPPCGINYHGIGITPDVEIEKEDDHDNQLDRAQIELQALINEN